MKLVTQHQNPSVTLIFRYFIQDEEEGQQISLSKAAPKSRSPTPPISSPTHNGRVPSSSTSFPPSLSSPTDIRSTSSPVASKLDKKALKKLEKEAKKQEEARLKAEKQAKKQVTKQLQEYEKQRMNAEQLRKQMGDVLFVWKTTPAQLLQSMKVVES